MKNSDLLFDSYRLECGFGITDVDKMTFSRVSHLDLFFHSANSLRLIDRDGRIQIDYFNKLADKPTSFIDGRMPDYMELFTGLENVSESECDLTYSRGVVLDLFYKFKKPVSIGSFSPEWRELIGRCLETVGVGDE